MKKTPHYESYIQILEEELIPALGCTEPIAIALAAAKARDALGTMPERCRVDVSGNIIKNVKAVTVPNTGGLKGIEAAAAAGLLKFGGRFAMCQRPERLGEIISLMTEHKLEPKRLRLVCKSEGNEPWLVLVEGRLGSGKGMRILPNLNIYKNGQISEEMLQIQGVYSEGAKANTGK